MQMYIYMHIYTYIYICICVYIFIYIEDIGTSGNPPIPEPHTAHFKITETDGDIGWVNGTGQGLGGIGVEKVRAVEPIDPLGEYVYMYMYVCIYIHIYIYMFTYI
jgi:hypothetical protein